MIRNLAALIGRVVVGLVFLARGWPKLQDPSAAVLTFQQLHAPFPEAMAWYAAIVETVGAIFLILGLALPIVGLLLAIDVAGMVALTTGLHGLIAWGDGTQFLVLLGAAAVAAGFNGGTIAIGQTLFGAGRRRDTWPKRAGA
ncbi:MAG TPA: DoxX family protein [Candidatus Dormibacteraeota bacterium]|nr:DoxX family protein [Candidatus Dormibacteraeota bacterium]